MDALTDRAFSKVMLLVSQILYPKWPPYYFPVYMFYLFLKIMNLQRTFNIQVIPDELINKLLKCKVKNARLDPNNCIMVDERYVKHFGLKNAAIVYLKNNSTVKGRIVNLCSTKMRNQGEIVVSDSLMYNFLKHDIKDTINLYAFSVEHFKVATEVNVSLISVYDDISSSIIEVLLKNYFKTPKLLYKNDVISVDVEKYGAEFFYLNRQLNEMKFVHFKCNKITFGDTDDCRGCYICVSDRTCLKQSSDVQSYLPSRSRVVKSLEIEQLFDFEDFVVDMCPHGLQIYFEALEKAVLPFLNKRTLKLKPAFLLQGPKGCAADLIIEALASKHGLHLYKFSSVDIACHVYAQTETRLHTLFFRTKLAAPCVLLINNFENFGKNNEGVYDQRIVNSFKSELQILLESNPLPVILMCISNNKNVDVDLKRTFLEVFTIDAPSQQERLQMLKWIIDKDDLYISTDLHDVSSKCNVYLFEDLRTLVFYAKKSWFEATRRFESKPDLGENQFGYALDLMQMNYSESIGAPKVPKVKWTDVGGLDDVKNEIIKTIQLPLQHPEFFETSGLRRSGILLYGPPGTGKTLLAKAVATECNLCFLAVKGPELLNMYVGQSEQNIREVFDRARQASPCIIFFDELDSLAPNRGISGDSGGVMDRVVSQLLAEMDGLNQSATLFIIGATNRPDLIDAALLRPGRFDKLLYVGPGTDLNSKLSVLKALTRKFNLGKEVDLEKVVQKCPGNITGADFYGLCSNAWMSAVRKVINNIDSGDIADASSLTSETVKVNMEDFEEAIQNIRPSVKPEDLVYFEKLKKEYSVRS